MRHAGALRIDHAMGLSRLFWIPDGGTGADGAYVAYPFADLLGQLALESARARCMVVGEDLGTVPDGFRPAMTEADILSYRVLLLEREGRISGPRQSYPARSGGVRHRPTIWRRSPVGGRAPTFGNGRCWG